MSSPASRSTLPFGAGLFDAVVCACTWCTFPDGAGCGTEFTRVVIPGVPR